MILSILSRFPIEFAIEKMVIPTPIMDGKTSASQMNPGLEPKEGVEFSSSVNGGWVWVWVWMWVGGAGGGRAALF